MKTNQVTNKSLLKIVLILIKLDNSNNRSKLLRLIKILKILNNLCAIKQQNIQDKSPLKMAKIITQKIANQLTINSKIFYQVHKL